MGGKPFEYLRELAAGYWKPLLTLISAFFAILVSSEDFLQNHNLSLPLIGSKPISRWMVVGVFIFILIIIRFPRVAAAITRWIFGRPPLPPGVGRIFRGPAPYGSHDQLPARKLDVDDCWTRIERESFLVIDGESGCGKTSFLSAGLIPKARESYQVIECRVSDDPFAKLFAALSPQVMRTAQQTVTENDVAEAIRAAARSGNVHEASAPASTNPLLLCLDQFEELFVTVAAPKRTQFITILKEAVDSKHLKLILAIRSDFLDLLLRVCRLVDPEHKALNVGNYYTLTAFDQDQAEEVLNELLKPLHENDPLRMLQLQDFAKELVLDLLRPPRDERLFKADEKTVLPVELQTVGIMLESLGVKNFSVGGLKRLGGKAGLLLRYIEDAKTYVWRKTGVPRDEALLILRELVSPARTKWTQSAESVAAKRKLPVDQVERVLNAFGERYLINQLPEEATDGGTDVTRLTSRYELMHEHLVHLLVDAPDPVLQKRRAAEQRLSFWIAQAKSAFAPLGERHRYSFPGRLRSLLNQPIPLVESIRLWRYARDYDERRILKRNFMRFHLRLTILVLAFVLPYAFWVLISFFFVARAPVNARLSNYNPSQGYRLNQLIVDSNNTNSLFICLAFSGGGTRASALSFGVLKKLAALNIEWEGKQKRLLDEVDCISSVSGGSFTAAYYSLFGDRIFADFQQKFLYRGIQRELIGLLFNPMNLIRLSSPYFSRIDLAAELYDTSIFEGKTFYDLVAKNRRPFLVLNATDSTVGERFEFTQDQFDVLGSDLAAYPIARAVAASSASPLFLNPVTLKNHPQPNNYSVPLELENALKDYERNRGRYLWARKQLIYVEKNDRPFIHLIDGQQADNLGLRFIEESHKRGDLRRLINNGEIRRLVIIVVSSNVDSSGAQTIELMKDRRDATIQAQRAFRDCQMLLAQACPTAPRIPFLGGPIEPYIVEVNFENLPDAMRRNYLLSLPTSFSLSREQVDDLIAVGEELLEKSPEFQRFIRDLGNRR